MHPDAPCPVADSESFPPLMSAAILPYRHLMAKSVPAKIPSKQCRQGLKSIARRGFEVRACYPSDSRAWSTSPLALRGSSGGRLRLRVPDPLSYKIPPAWDSTGALPALTGQASSQSSRLLLYYGLSGARFLSSGSCNLGIKPHVLLYMGADLNVDTQNGAFTAFPWGAASKRRGNDEDAGYRRNARF